MVLPVSTGILNVIRTGMSEMRTLKSFSLDVGEALQDVVQPGDTLGFSRNEMRDFSYRLAENCKMILSAGHELDKDGSMASQCSRTALCLTFVRRSSPPKITRVL